MEDETPMQEQNQEQEYLDLSLPSFESQVQEFFALI